MNHEPLPAQGPVDRRVGRLRWKKDPAETGLARVGASQRGHTLHDGEKEYAHVSPLGGGWRAPLRGWFWTCPTSAVGEYANTCNDPAPDEATAKAQAMAFVKARLTPNAKVSGAGTASAGLPGYTAGDNTE